MQLHVIACSRLYIKTSNQIYANNSNWSFLNACFHLHLSTSIQLVLNTPTQVQFEIKSKQFMKTSNRLQLSVSIQLYVIFQSFSVPVHLSSHSDAHPSFCKKHRSSDKRTPFFSCKGIQSPTCVGRHLANCDRTR